MKYRSNPDIYKPVNGQLASVGSNSVCIALSSELCAGELAVEDLISAIYNGIIIKIREAAVFNKPSLFQARFEVARLFKKKPYYV